MCTFSHPHTYSHSHARSLWRTLGLPNHPFVLGRVISMCKYFQESVKNLSLDYYNTLRRHNYVTPTSYLELILTFKTLLNTKRHEVDMMRNRYLTGLQKLEFASSQVSTATREQGQRGPGLGGCSEALVQVQNLRGHYIKTASTPILAELTLLASASTQPYEILSFFKILVFCSSWMNPECVISPLGPQFRLLYKRAVFHTKKPRCREARRFAKIIPAAS